MRVFLSRFFRIKLREGDFVYLKKERQTRKVQELKEVTKAPKGVRLATQKEIQTAVLLEISGNVHTLVNSKKEELQEEGVNKLPPQKSNNRRNRRSNKRNIH